MTTTTTMLVYDLSATRPAGSTAWNDDFSFKFSPADHPTDTMTIEDSGSGTQDQTFSDDYAPGFSTAGAGNQVIQNDFLGFASTGHSVAISNWFTVTGDDGSSFKMWGIRTGNSQSSDPIGNGDFIFVSEQPLLPNVTYTVTYQNNSTPPEAYSNFAICFAKHTQLLTPSGPVAVETLEVGQEVITADHGVQKVQWIGRRVIDQAELRAVPKLRPIRITAGAMGQGLPARDLWISPQHRMLACSKIAERMFGDKEVLISANKLTSLPGIYVDEAIAEVEYFHVLFDHHEIIFAEGCPSESLYTGHEALKAIAPEAREEVLSLFPELNRSDYKPAYIRQMPIGKLQKRLIERHHKNHALLLQDNAPFAEHA